MQPSGHHRSLGSWGVETGFWDASGRWRDSPEPALAAVAEAMGATGEGPPPPVMVTVRLDHPLPEMGAGTLVLEDGAEVDAAGGVPPGVPPGYHSFHPRGGEPYPLVVSPGRAPLPPRQEWGFSVQLYAARSASSWGIGDLADLCRIGRWSASAGAGAVFVNPLHAASPCSPQQASPYFAGSRCFLNPLYLAVERVPGAEGEPVDAAAAAGRLLNAQRRIDRDRVWELKSAALEEAFGRFEGDLRFDSFLEERGEPLRRFAQYCALCELHGPLWQRWPQELRHPGSAAASELAASREGAARLRYHAWLQWQLDCQLGWASEPLGVVQDLAVGVDPGGADAWIWQDATAASMRFGAPADEFNTQGQNWALAPLDPWRLRSSGYRPWIEALRQGFRHGAGLRIDHVMGLFRLYWIPDGFSAAEGAYVRYPHDDLLNILALEAHRAGSFVTGEDLGTVEDRVRADLAERQVMTYRVWWFERTRTPEWPRNSLGSLSTHDLPTVAGVLSGSDLDAQRRIGMEPNEQACEALRSKLLDWTGCEASAEVGEVVLGAHRDLARAPCLLLSASLDDALAVEERPNMPGTVAQWPNWSLALPLPLEEIETSSLATGVASVLGRGRP